MAIFYQPPEPRQAYPKVLPQTQGAQPKPAGPLGGSVNALTAVGVWATLAAVPMPVQKPLNVVPLTLTYGSQPAPQPSLTVAEQVIARVWWPEAFEPRLQWNDQQPERRYIVVQTLKYGSQPAPQAPLSAALQNVGVRWWDLPQQSPPALVGVAAIKGTPALPVVVAFSPTNPAIALWPQPGWLAQWGPAIAPLTLPRGDSVPFTPQQVVVVALSWPAQSAPPSAAWNVPVVAQTIVLIGSARQAMWDAVRQEPPRPVAIATLTLPRGDSVPFFRPPILWPALDWPYQSEENSAGWNFVAPVISQPTPYTVQLHVIRGQWEPPYIYPESEANNAGWNVPAIVNNPIPRVPQLHVVRYAWEPPFQYPQTLVGTAGWNFIVLLTRAIAQNAGSAAISSDSEISPINSANSGTSPIISVE